MSSFITARDRVLSAAASYIASEKHLEASDPGPHDDAEMEYKADALDDAMFQYFMAKEGHDTCVLMYKNPDGVKILMGIPWGNGSDRIPPPTITFTDTSGNRQMPLTFTYVGDGS